MTFEEKIKIVIFLEGYVDAGTSARLGHWAFRAFPFAVLIVDALLWRSFWCAIVSAFFSGVMLTDWLGQILMDAIWCVHRSVEAEWKANAFRDRDTLEAWQAKQRLRLSRSNNLQQCNTCEMTGVIGKTYCAQCKGLGLVRKAR